jgi:AcrR family transcriptional regulator
MEKEQEITTQEKIIQAAKTIFFKKGYDATRTRDIAAEAGANLAMLNYYFKSKENLFDIVMTQTLLSFMSAIIPILNDTSTPFETKIKLVVEAYLKKFIEEPELPYFVLSQLNKNPEAFAKKIKSKKEIENSILVEQFIEGIQNGKYLPVNFIHLIMNLGGLLVFPFTIKPSIQKIGKLSDLQFDAIIEERKQLIPFWIMKIISVNQPD